MALSTIPLKVLDVSTDDKFAAVIEQVSTRMILDGVAGKFVSPATAQSPYLPLKVGLAGTPGARIARLDQVIDPSKGWSDGRYTVTFYDVSMPVPRPTGEDVFDVISGTWGPVTPTANAVRLLASTAGPGTVRDSLSKIATKV